MLMNFSFRCCVLLLECSCVPISLWTRILIYGVKCCCGLRFCSTVVFVDILFLGMKFKLSVLKSTMEFVSA